MGDITFNGFKMALLENLENEGTRMFTLFNAPESLARQWRKQQKQELSFFGIQKMGIVHQKWLLTFFEGFV